ncbi:MAG: NUDIX hydrolase [Candidatus Doudnabacteria bacterium]|nr:NUDIX hydrolase [Candidatus Doudnabacteria bacterium]
MDKEIFNPNEYKEKPRKIVTRAILFNEKNEVLLGKRVRGGGIGKWALVGGKPEGNETPEEAIVREVKEELGLDFEPTIFGKVEDQVSADRAQDEQHAWDVYTFYGKYKGTPVFKSEEISELALVSKDTLDEFDIAFNHKEILQNFFDTWKI